MGNMVRGSNWQYCFYCTLAFALFLLNYFLTSVVISSEWISETQFSIVIFKCRCQSRLISNDENCVKVLIDIFAQSPKFNFFVCRSKNNLVKSARSYHFPIKTNDERWATSWTIHGNTVRTLSYLASFIGSLKVLTSF